MKWNKFGYKARGVGLERGKLQVQSNAGRLVENARRRRRSLLKCVLLLFDITNHRFRRRYASITVWVVCASFVYLTMPPIQTRHRSEEVGMFQSRSVLSGKKYNIFSMTYQYSRSPAPPKRYCHKIVTFVATHPSCFSSVVLMSTNIENRNTSLMWLHLHHPLPGISFQAYVSRCSYY